jgi:hypothetical protein
MVLSPLRERALERFAPGAGELAPVYTSRGRASIFRAPRAKLFARRKNRRKLGGRRACQS